MSVTIRRVTTAADLNAVSRLRFSIYALEEGMDLPDMDRYRQTLSDPLDEHAFILGAFDGPEAVATVRVVPIAALPQDSDLRDLFECSNFPVPEEQQLTIGRLFVRDSHRGSSCCLQLLSLCYAHCLEHHYELAFLECRPRHVPLYESIGCRPYKQPTGDRPYGLMVPMAFLLRDLAHLSRIRSPIRSAVSSAQHNRRLAEWFAARFPQFEGPASVRLMTSDAQNALLASLKRARCALMSDVDVSDVVRILRQSSVLRIDAGATILRAGTKGTELYLILDGYVGLSESSKPEHQTLSILGPDDVFGEECFLSGAAASNRLETRSVTPVRLLTITREGLDALRTSTPTLAIHVLSGLCRSLSNRLSKSLASECAATLQTLGLAGEARNG